MYQRREVLTPTLLSVYLSNTRLHHSRSTRVSYCPEIPSNGLNRTFPVSSEGPPPLSTRLRSPTPQWFSFRPFPRKVRHSDCFHPFSDFSSRTCPLCRSDTTSSYFGLSPSPFSLRSYGGSRSSCGSLWYDSSNRKLNVYYLVVFSRSWSHLWDNLCLSVGPLCDLPPSVLVFPPSSDTEVEPFIPISGVCPSPLPLVLFPFESLQVFLLHLSLIFSRCDPLTDTYLRFLLSVIPRFPFTVISTEGPKTEPTEAPTPFDFLLSSSIVNKVRIRLGPWHVYVMLDGVFLKTLPIIKIGVKFFFLWLPVP